MNKTSDRLFWAFIAITVPAAFLWALWLTPFGAGISPDSIVYLAGAKSLLAGQGFSSGGLPVTHFPPLYSLTLAVAGLANVNIAEAARVGNALLWGLNATLIGGAVYLATARDAPSAIGATLAFLASTPMLILHLSVYSEPIFLAWLLMSVIALTMYAREPLFGWLLAASACLGLACVTRYAGVALLPVALAVVCAAARPLQRLLSACLLLGVSCGPLTVVALRNRFVAGTVADRSLVAHPPQTPSLTAFLQAMREFWLPAGSSDRVVVLVVLCLALVPLVCPFLFVLFTRTRRTAPVLWRLPGLVMPAICLFFSAMTTLLVGLTISYFDAQTPMDTRLLAPVFVLLLGAAFVAVGTATDMLRLPSVRWAWLAVIALMIVVKFPELRQVTEDSKRDGRMFAALNWRHSATVAFVETVPARLTIYSNGADAITYLTGRPSTRIPSLASPNTTERNPRYGDDVRAMCARITSGEALLVYFTTISWRSYLPSADALASACPMPVLMRYGDGVVYGVRVP